MSFNKIKDVPRETFYKLSIIVPRETFFNTLYFMGFPLYYYYEIKMRCQMGKTIGIFNQKGGVGKTTTAINLAAGLGRRNKKVLLIDLDPQGNATSGLGIEKGSLEANIYDNLHNDTPMSETIIETNAKNLSLVPSGIELAGLEIELANSDDWHYKIKNAIEEVKEDYDIILIDCPPSLGILSIMALIASDYVLIPIQSEFYALEGTGQLLETIEMVKENYNENLEILGVIMVMHDARTRLSSDVVAEVKDVFGDAVFKTIINRNVRLAEAPSYGMSIFDYDRISKGAWNYRSLSKEVIDRMVDND